MIINQKYNTMCDIYNPSYYFALFFTSSFATYILYKFVYTILYRYNSNFLTLKYEKQSYVAKNIAKSILLCVLCVYGLSDVLCQMYNNNWCSHDMRTCSAIYGSIDFMGLVIVPNLPSTTKIHHVISTILIFVSFYIPFEEPNISTLLAIYALLSAFAFSVNMYLGLRLIGVYNKLRIFAMYNYIICCIINWSLLLITLCQHVMLNVIGYPHLIVLILMMGLVRDDLILINWLYNDGKKKGKIIKIIKLE